MSTLFVKRGPRDDRDEVSQENPLPVSLERSSVRTTGRIVRLAAEFLRPADTSAYAALDVIATSTTAAQATGFSFTGVGLSGYIVGALLTTSDVDNAAIHRLHLFQTLPNPMFADNALYIPRLTERHKPQGYIDVGPMAQEAATALMSSGLDMTLRVPYVTDDGTLRILLQTRSAFTPDSGQIYRLEFWFDVSDDVPTDAPISLG